jgi:ArsR family transcriptional regulator
MSIEVCEVNIIHQDVVDKVKAELSKETMVDEMATFFKAVADPTRLKIILALQSSELCVCDLAAIVGISISGLSHQLRYLRNLKIVKNRKTGKLVYYSLTDSHISQLLSIVNEHIKE